MKWASLLDYPVSLTGLFLVTARMFIEPLNYGEGKMAGVVTDRRSFHWRSIKCGILCSIGLLILCFGTAASAATPTATVEQGTLTGVDLEGVAVFRGVRYAMPPVGDFRWRPPQPVAPGEQQVD